MKYEDFLEHMKAIIDNDLEDSAISFLSDSIAHKLSDAREKKMEAEATVKAIRKLNKGKNPAIELLCEREGEQG